MILAECGQQPFSRRWPHKLCDHCGRDAFAPMLWKDEQIGQLWQAPPLELDFIHLDESAQLAIEPEQTGPLRLFLQAGPDIGKCAVVETIGKDLLTTPGRGFEVVQLINLKTTSASCAVALTSVSPSMQ